MYESEARFIIGMILLFSCQKEISPKQNLISEVSSANVGGQVKSTTHLKGLK
jgi:hypothetical protein